MAAEANDILAEAVRAHPTRFAGLAAVAPQDPNSVVRELERAKALGLKGFLINSHTRGEYLDLPKFAPIFEAAQALDMPLYLHPREPSPSSVTPYLDHGLFFAAWGFAAETSLHAMRLIMSGLFDRYPRLRIALGHMGEGMPFWLSRIDNRYKGQVLMGVNKRLARLPSEYFRDNFVITTSGMMDDAALRLAISVLGVERIQFAGDFPYEDVRAGVDFLRTPRSLTPSVVRFLKPMPHVTGASSLTKLLVQHLGGANERGPARAPAQFFAHHNLGLLGVHPHGLAERGWQVDGNSSPDRRSFLRPNLAPAHDGASLGQGV